MRALAAAVALGLAFPVAACGGGDGDGAATADKRAGPQTVATGRDSKGKPWKLTVEPFEAGGTCVMLEPGGGTCWGGRLDERRAIRARQADTGCGDAFVYGEAVAQAARVVVSFHHRPPRRATLHDLPAPLGGGSRVFVIRTARGIRASAAMAQDADGSTVGTATLRTGHGEDVC